MAVLSFPGSPTLNQTYTNGGKTWTWNGTNWYSASSVAVAVTPAAVSDQANTSTGYFALPVGTTAQQPVVPVTGGTRINSTSGYVEVYYNSTWNNTPINFSVGSTQSNPGSSAASIKALSGTTTDGWYWVTLPTVGATYVYCDMNTNGGGWMLAAKVYTDTSRFNGYSSTDWTTVGLFNQIQGPTYAGHIKSDVFNYWVTTVGLRLCTGTVTNNLYENWVGYSMVSLMNATTQNSQNTRSQWLAFIEAGGGTAASNFSGQPNCNQAGTNKNYNYNARIGISMNNEGDCSSNDSAAGFGGTFGPCGWTSWSPTATGTLVGYIWVK